MQKGWFLGDTPAAAPPSTCPGASRAESLPGPLFQMTPRLHWPRRVSEMALSCTYPICRGFAAGSPTQLTAADSLLCCQLLGLPLGPGPQERCLWGGEHPTSRNKGCQGQAPQQDSLGVVVCTLGLWGAWWCPQRGAGSQAPGPTAHSLASPSWGPPPLEPLEFAREEARARCQQPGVNPGAVWPGRGRCRWACSVMSEPRGTSGTTADSCGE